MKYKHIILAILILVLCSCNSSSVKDAIDLAKGVDRKPIDTTRMGINAFANQSFAGSICRQYREIKNTLKLNYVRVLFNWDNNVQPSPGAALDFSFYDAILDCIPAGVDALVILTNVPSWMSNSANWIAGNPRVTVAENWIRKVVERYQGNPKIIGYQIWNEPNNADFGENNIIDVLINPLNFLELVSLGYDIIKAVDPSKLVVNGATTSIAQNFPHTFNYNRTLKDAGIEAVVDRFAIHYYGNNFEVFLSDVKDFLRSIDKTIWITESGKQGVAEQLPYVETVWPFLRERVSGIDRIYYYRYAEATPSSSTFALVNPDGEAPVSDLYVHLRDREE